MSVQITQPVQLMVCSCALWCKIALLQIIRQLSILFGQVLVLWPHFVTRATFGLFLGNFNEFSHSIVSIAIFYQPFEMKIEDTNNSNRKDKM